MCSFKEDKKLILAVHEGNVTFFGGRESSIIGFKTELKKQFDMTDEKGVSFYLGMQIEQYEGEIHLHQTTFVN